MPCHDVVKSRREPLCHGVNVLAFVPGVEVRGQVGADLNVEPRVSAQREHRMDPGTLAQRQTDCAAGNLHATAPEVHRLAALAERPINQQPENPVGAQDAKRHAPGVARTPHADTVPRPRAAVETQHRIGTQRFNHGVHCSEAPRHGNGGNVPVAHVRTQSNGTAPARERLHDVLRPV